jgi:carbonic anhydrase
LYIYRHTMYISSLLVATSLLASTVSATCAHGTHLLRRAGVGADLPAFSYAPPTGPEEWASLAPEYAVCGTGLEQSPLDIPSSAISGRNSTGGVYSITTSPSRPSHVTLHPGSSLNIAIYDSTDAVLEHLGTTVQVSGVNGTLNLAGVAYELVQFHFHTPSEHRIDGMFAAGEVHFVFQTERGQTAVVGALLDIGVPSPGTNTTVSGDVLEKALKGVAGLGRKGDHTAVEPLEFHALLEHLKDAEVYRYAGSLTTPPCSEGVSWLLSSNPLHIAPSTWIALKSIMGFNARPVQGRPSHRQGPLSAASSSSAPTPTRTARPQLSRPITIGPNGIEVNLGGLIDLEVEIGTGKLEVELEIGGVEVEVELEAKPRRGSGARED